MSRLIFLSVVVGGGLWLTGHHRAQAEIQLPDQDDVPEEVLRTEIIFEARSPIDGQPLDADDYAILQAELQEPPESPLINSELRELIFLLQLRGAIRSTIPFFP